MAGSFCGSSRIQKDDFSETIFANSISVQNWIAGILIRLKDEQKRTKGMTQQSGSPSSFSPSQISETDFEKQRGISRVEVRTGLTQVHVLDLSEPISKSRLRVLDAVSSAGISLDFLKLTPNGM